MKKIILILLATLLAGCNETPVDGDATGDSTVVEPKVFQEVANLIGSQIIVGAQPFDSVYRVGSILWEPLKYAPMVLVDTLGYQTLRMTCWFPEGVYSPCYDLIQHPVYYPLEKLETLEETDRGYHVVATTHWIDQDIFGGANSFAKLPQGLDISISMDITISKNKDTTEIIMCIIDTPRFCADADSIVALAVQDGDERVANLRSLAGYPCQWPDQQICLDILAIRDPDL
jgi:hypothetical protein